MDRGTSRPHVLIGAAALLCVLVVPLTATGVSRRLRDPEATTSVRSRSRAEEEGEKPSGPGGRDSEAARSPGTTR